MKWYESDGIKELDYDRPIVAEDSSCNKHLLLPQMTEGNSCYSITGYNWFNINKGKYNSCAFFKTAKAAVESYKLTMKISNAEITIQEENK